MMTLIPQLPTSDICTFKKVLYQDSGASHYDFTATTFSQDFTLMGLPANYILVGYKFNLIVEFVNFTESLPSEVLVYLGTPDTLVNPAQAQGTGQPTDSLLGSMNLSPTVRNGSTLLNSSYWFQVGGPGNFSPNGGICKPSTFAAHDIVARFIAMQPPAGGSNPKISTIQQGMVEITLQYCSI